MEDHSPSLDLAFNPSSSTLVESSEATVSDIHVHRPFDLIPEAILDHIVSETLQEDTSLRIAFLSHLGPALHFAACRILFHTIVLQDDDRVFKSSDRAFRSPLAAILNNSNRYGPFVRTLEVVDPCPTEEHSTLLLNAHYAGTQEPGREVNGQYIVQPLSTGCLEDILQGVPSLDTFIWRSTSCPPDGICEMLSSYNPCLTSFNYLPTISLVSPAKSRQIQSMARWDALSLPMLSTLGLTSLRVSRLSHSGARSLANLLSLVNEETLLENVLVDTNWLDEHICHLLGNACRRAKRLEVGSDGTRFSDNCIVTLLSLCGNLEKFTLRDIQGRLSKSLWEKVELILPSSLRRIGIRISEYNLQHSWAIDHLASLHHLPMEALTHLSITRQFNPYKPLVSEAAALNRAPANLVQALQKAKRLQQFECDWWFWGSDDLKFLFEHCSSLRILRVAIDAPFVKLLSMASLFSIATDLERLAVFVPEEHCPVMPPSPPTSMHHIPSRSPSASPLQRNRTFSGSLGGPDSPSDDKSATTQFSQLNSDMVPLRDVKKFARRCSSLKELIWYGKDGIRTQWAITRNLSIAQSVSNLHVERMHSYQSLGELWNSATPERDSHKVNGHIEFVEREGATWIGPNAEYYQALRTLEKEKEDQMAKSEKAARASSRKLGASSLGIEVSFPKTSTKSTTISPVEGLSEIPTPVSPADLKPAVPSRKHPIRPKRRSDAVNDSKPSSNFRRTTSLSPERPRAQSYASHGAVINGASNPNNYTRFSERRGSTGVPGYRRASHPGQPISTPTNHSSSRNENPERGRGTPRRSVV